MEIPFQSTKFIIGKLGPAAAGSTTVGYSIFNQFGSLILPKTTEDVIELGDGDFGAPITFGAGIFPQDFIGYIKWDDGVSLEFNESINIVSDVAENISMLFDKNKEIEFIPASVPDPNRNVLVGMYDGMVVRHKLDSQDNFDNPILEDFILFTYKSASPDSDIIKRSPSEDFDGYGGGYGPYGSPY